MGQSRRILATPVISAVSLCVAVGLPGCSASSPAADPPGSAAATARSATHSAVLSPEAAAFTFAVTGTHPVAPNGSQDTNAQAQGIGCDSAKLTSDHALGLRIARGFALTGFSVGADLLRRFPAGDTLDGFGPPRRYLQTACGAPQHRGGARWFPDTITVTVPFNRPA